MSERDALVHVPFVFSLEHQTLPLCNLHSDRETEGERERHTQREREREREVWKRNNWTMCWYHWVYWCLDYTTFGFCSLSSAFPDEPSLVSMLKLATNGSSPWWVLSPSSLSLSLSLSLCVCTLQALTSYVYIYIYIYVCVCVCVCLNSHHVKHPYYGNIIVVCGFAFKGL